MGREAGLGLGWSHRAEVQAGTCLCLWPAESGPVHYSCAAWTFQQSDSFAAIEYGKAVALLPRVRRG